MMTKPESGDWVTANAHASKLLIALTGCLVGWLMVACGGGNEPATPVVAENDAPATAVPFGIATPSEIKDLSYLPGDLIRTGAEFADGGPQQLTAVDEDSCTFSPDWDPASPAASMLSYACYGFTLDGYDRPGEIAFTFTEIGYTGDAWIGLSNFADNRWEWQLLPVGNTLTADLTGYREPGTGRLLVLPLFTGTESWTLSWIKIGDLAAVDGFVYDADGITPLTGVEVVLTDVEEFSARTDAAGYWVIDGVIPGDYTVTPWLVGWAFNPVTRQVAVDNDDQFLESFTGTPAPGNWVSGAITNDEGFGLGGFDVVITHQHGHGSVSIVTSKSGTWQFNLPDGDYTVAPTRYCWEFAPEDYDFTVAGAPVTTPVFIGTEVDGARVDGYVYHGDTTEPFNDVRVSVYHDTLDLMYSAQTDASGYWSISDLLEGGYTAEVVEVGYAFTPDEQTFAITGPDVTLDPFRGTPLGQFDIEGYVYDDGGSTPLAGINIQLTGQLGWQNTTTDFQGKYAFRDTWAGQYTVTPTESGYTFAPSSQNVDLTGDIVLDPFLGTKLPSYTVDGYIYETHSTTPVQGVEVSLFTFMPQGSYYSAVTDIDGHYVVTDVPDGFYNVTPARQGVIFTPRDQGITVEGADLTVPDFMAEVPPSYTVDGYIFETNGTTPVPGVTVALDGLTNKYSFEAVTDETGHWVAEEVLEDTYNVTPGLAPWIFTPEVRQQIVSGASVTVPPFIGVELEAYPVDGYVFEEGTTTPVPDVDVSFKNGLYKFSCPTDAAGYYSILIPLGDWVARPIAGCWDFDPEFQNITVTTVPQTLLTFYAVPGG